MEKKNDTTAWEAQEATGKEPRQVQGAHGGNRETAQHLGGGKTFRQRASDKPKTKIIKWGSSK